MITCLISLIVAAIVLLLVIVVIEAIAAQFFAPYGQVAWLVRLLFGLLLLLYALDCLLGLGFAPHWAWR